ncbi:hypothetical protein [Stenotrophomonas rhizophila]|jgi:hypothetical protein|uniref:hypothetical protein n=1 Tax=Stenotrophomonas rhizophila TaxID=216778 RepID=UPI00112F6D25|nr:hypothetical protein [Stenotrophomonas rhizophila]
MSAAIMSNIRPGYGLLAKLHLRLMRGRPEMDVLAVLLLATVCLLGGLGLMLNHAVRDMFLRSGDASVLLVTARGSSGEVESFVKSLSMPALKGALTEAGFKDLALDEQLVISSSITEGGRQKFLAVRGAAASQLQKLGGVRMVDGRMYAADRNELIVGRAAARAFPSFKPGARIELAQQQWLITGVFEMQGDVRENEVVGDLQRVQYVHGAHGIVSSVRIAAAGGAGEVARMAEAINADDELEFSADSEAEYFEQQSRPVLKSVVRLQILIMGLMIPAALLGLLSIQRVQNMNMLAELRMLSFIGFQARSIRMSLLVRALALGVVAGLAVCTVVGLGVAGRSVELEMGLQVLDIRFQAAPWIYAAIVAASCMLSAAAALLSNIEKDLYQ